MTTFNRFKLGEKIPGLILEASKNSGYSRNWIPSCGNKEVLNCTTTAQKKTGMKEKLSRKWQKKES